MLRMTEIGRTHNCATMAIDGRLVGDHVVALEVEGRRLLQECSHVIFHVDGLQFIDADGLALLNRWRDRTTLTGGSAFVRALLARHGLMPGDGEPAGPAG